MDHFDIMIVGAGPAGISTWLHLKKVAPELADHVLVIDKAVFPRPKVCGGGLGAWCEDVLRQLDIDLNIPSLYVPKVEFRFRDHRWIYQSPNPFRMVQRADLDLALLKSAVKRGMAHHESEQFLEAKQNSNGLTVQTNRGEYHVKAIVGADGALSMVRRSMMRSQPSCLAPTIQVSTPVNPHYDTEFAHQILSLDFSPIREGLQGYVWQCPYLENGSPYMNRGIANFRYPPGRPRANMKKIFQRALHGRNADDKSVPWRSHPIRWLSPEARISLPNVILVGDAAGIEPAFGGGIHMALSYGEIAARELIQAFRAHDFSFRHYRKNLMSHRLGQYLLDYTLLAKKIYSGNGHPLEQLREFFTNRLIGHKLRSLLLSQQNVR
ncbi:MAG: FAD-dependent monooxygenase [Desulfobacterales bacterium]